MLTYSITINNQNNLKIALYDPFNKQKWFINGLCPSV